jgi:hypothetical protein
MSNDSCNLSARLASLAMKFVCETCESCYKISFCETSKKRFLLRNFVARLDSHNKISGCETREKLVLLLIWTHESHKNLARILVLKSESCFSREFQKVILMSTLIVKKSGSPNQTIM